MKNLIQNIILVITLTIIILCSYALVQDKINSLNPSEIYLFLKNQLQTNHSKNDNQSTDLSDNPNTYKAVWLSYLEFNAYQNSVSENNEEAFRDFFQRVLNRCKKIGLNHIIVHVRPFGDALYESEYYPWAACISGKQGKSPGYDPLKIMVEMAHKEGIKIEAWINPFRISSGSSISDLSDDNQAKLWSTSPETERNILTYENALYYNPASEQVRELICNGVQEIVNNYNVDGIHMDDYFYPTFTKETYTHVFDAVEYEKAKEEKRIADNTTIEDWRREKY